MSRRDTWQGMNWIRQEKRLAIYIRDNFICQHCQLDLKVAVKAGSDLRIELDHLQPVSRGGTNGATNLVTSCNKCNTSRGDTSLYKFHNSAYADAVIQQAALPINIPLAKQVLTERKAQKEAQDGD